MDMLTHSSIYLFPIVMLLVIYINNQKKRIHTPDKRQFDLLTLLTLGFMVVDLLSMGLKRMDWAGARIGLWIFYILHIILMVAVPCVWLVYVCQRLFTESMERRTKYVIRVAVGAFILVSLVTLTTPWTHAIFSVTESGNYELGSCFYLPYVLSVALLLESILIAGHVYRYEKIRERRLESMYLLCFGIVSFVGVGMQHLRSGWWLGGPSIALSILFIYINTQNRQITTDSLTGLNNRREFNQQLQKKAEQSCGREWGMLMLDVDDFKAINDELGHRVGDEALWQTADILRSVLDGGKAFLARYGGDEFVIMDDYANEGEAGAAIERIGAEVSRFNREAGKPYQLSLSIGHALWSEAEENMETLVNKADERMYEEKARKKKRKMTGAV